MLKIIHIINALNTGGAELALARLVSLADRSTFDMQVVSLLGDGPVGQRIRNQGIRVHCLQLSKPGSIVSEMAALVQLLRREKPDVIQTWLQQSDLLGSIAAKFAGVGPVLWNIRHSTLHPKYIKRSTRVVTHLCASLSPLLPWRIVCCSESSRVEQIKIGYAKDKLTVIPNGVSTTLFQPDSPARAALRRELGLSPNTVLIGAAGRYHPQKDYRTLIHAAKAIFDAAPDCELAICGDHVTALNGDLARWIAETGIGNRIHMLGRRDDMPKFMAALDLFVSSACFGEGFPNVVAEAMSCGTPCVVTDIGDSALIVGSTGKVVQPEDPGALARACLEMREAGRETRGGLGMAARARIVSEFSMGRMVSSYEQLYLQAAA
jgi:glycosyltransferase involved in cell wall biosynthesis